MIPGPPKPGSPVALKSLRRRTEALELREQGLSFEAIAQRMGIAKFTAWKLVNKALKANTRKYQEKSEHLIEIQKSRLERVIAGLNKKVDAGDARACEVYIKANESLRKLLGLDAPEKKDIRVGIGALEDFSDAELQEQARRLGLHAEIKVEQLPYVLPGDTTPNTIIPEILDEPT